MSGREIAARMIMSTTHILVAIVAAWFAADILPDELGIIAGSLVAGWLVCREVI